MSKNAFRNWRCGYGMALALCLMLVFASSLVAQTAATGALTGTVTDSTGAVIPNATVTATNTGTGQARNTTTESNGVYKIPLLTPGTYRVRFEAPGFNPVEVPSANVNVTETEVLDRSLQVGAQTQEVSVQADVETVQTASSALGTVVNTETVTELPLNTRNYTNLLAMSAGAASGVNNATTLGKGSAVIAVNGGGTGQNTFLQDGVSINNWYSFGTGTEGTIYGAFAVPNPDTIEEFKIQTSTYDAGYGRNPGANVNVVTKSGTNEFHGVGFEFFRNTVLNANDWFYKHSELAAGQANVQPTLNQNQFGGVFGGPVKKDKLFFFISYQETQQKNGLSGYGFSTVVLPPVPGNRGTCPIPSAAVQSSASAASAWYAGCDTTGQAFVTALATAISPNCPTNASNKSDKSLVSGGINVACPTIPTTGSNVVSGAAQLYNINPVAIKLLQAKLANGNYMIPGLPAAGAAYATTSISDPAIFKDHQGLGNFDYLINGKNTLSGRYFYEDDPLLAPFPVQNANLAGTNLIGSPVVTEKMDHSAILKLTTIVTSNLVNEARISYQRYVTDNGEQTPFRDSQFGIADLSPGTSPISDDLSYFCVTGEFCFGGHEFFDIYLPENQFQWADQVSWTHGKHAIRAGFEAERIQMGQTYPSLSLGAPTFQSFPDFLIGRAAGSSTTGLGDGSTTLSNVNNGGGSTAANSQFPFQFRATNLNGFLQDDFKVNSQLTLNLGVRWEYDGFLSEKYGNYSNFWPTLYNAQPNPGSGCVLTGGSVGQGASGTGCSLVGFMVPSNYNGPQPTGLYKSSHQYPSESGPPKDDFAPRVGFAWQPTKSDRWVLRGGAGYFYDLVPGELPGNQMTHTSPGYGFPVPSSPNATIGQPVILPGVIPAGPGAVGFAPRWVNPSSTATALNISSNLGNNVVSQNITVPLVYEWNLNTQYEFAPTWVLEVGYVGSHGIHQVPQGVSGTAQSTTTYYNLADLVGDGHCNSCTLLGVAKDTAANAPQRVPYLGMSPQDVIVATVGGYKYDALQATVRKQLSHGLQLQAAYTWARALFTTTSGINTYPYVTQEYGPNFSYRPQRLIVNYTWNIPLGQHQGIEGKLLNGWTTTGVWTLQDGQPLTITDSRGGSVFGAPTTLSTAQFCSGATNTSVQAPGSVEQRVINSLQGTGGYFNTTGVFCAPPPLAFPGADGVATGFGNAGVGIVYGPGQNNWDMSLAKSTVVGGIREGGTLQFRVELFNAFNHAQFSNPTLANPTSGTFGQITSMSVSPRIIQLGLKYSF